MIRDEPVTRKSCFFLKSANTSHGLSRSSYHLGDFFVREREREPDLALLFVLIRREVQQEARHLLGRGVREANGAHFRDRRMIGFTEMLRHAERCLAVLTQEAEKILPRNE